MFGVARMEERSGKLVGRIRCKVYVVDGAGEELTESEAPPGCGGVQKPGADALAYMSEGTLCQETACHSASAERAHFTSRPGKDGMEGCPGVLAEPAA